MHTRKNPHLYEINTRVWLKDLSRRHQKPITLASVPKEEWLGLKKLGFDIVWLMGIWTPSPQAVHIAQTLEILWEEYNQVLEDCTLEDVIGSPYAIFNYEPNPDIGNWQDLAMVRDTLHELDMRLMLDFVPNHVAIDHPWTKNHPEYFVLGDSEMARRAKGNYFLVKVDDKPYYIAHGKDPFFPPWIDTAQLNYFHPQLRQAQLETLMQIANYCDGLRCDMAMLELNDVHQSIWGANFQAQGYAQPKTEFWQEAIDAIKAKHPEFLFMAEVYWGKDQQLKHLGFDYVYDKVLYDHWLQNSAATIRQYLNLELHQQEQMARFLENHDEARIASRLNQNKSLAAATLLATLPGLRFYHEGQLQGMTKKIPVQIGRRPEEPVNHQIEASYVKLLSITSDDVFHDGQWSLVGLKKVSEGNDSYQNMIAYQWNMGHQLYIIVANYADTRSQAWLHTQEFDNINDEKITLYDALNNQTYSRHKSELCSQGLFIDLQGFQGHIFHLTKSKNLAEGTLP